MEWIVLQEGMGWECTILPSFGMSRDNLKWLLCLRCASFLIVIIIFIVIIIITTIK